MRLEILMENRGTTLIAPLMFFCVIASASEAIKRVGILCSLIAALVTLARNDTWNLVMLSEAKHLYGFHSLCFPLVFIFLCDSPLDFFRQGGQGG